MKKLFLITPLLFLAGCATTDFGASSSYGYSSSGIHIHSSSSGYYPYSSTYRYRAYPHSIYGNVYYDPVLRRYITLRPGQTRPVIPYRTYRPYRPINSPHRPIYNPHRPIQRPHRPYNPSRPTTPRPRPDISNPRPRPGNSTLKVPPHHGSTRERIGPVQQEK